VGEPRARGGRSRRAALLIGLAALARQQLWWWRDSTRLFTRAVAYDDREPFTRELLAESLLVDGRAAEALPHFAACDGRGAGEPPQPLFLWDGARESREDESAAREFQEAVRLRPGDADALRKLAEALGRAGHYAEAVVRMKEYLRVEHRPENLPGAHFLLGFYLQRAGRPEEAAAHLAVPSPSIREPPGPDQAGRTPPGRPASR